MSRIYSWALPVLLLPLFLAGCAGKPPQTLPTHFEGTCGQALSSSGLFTIDWTQNGKDLKGTYDWEEFQGGKVDLGKGEITGVSSGDQVNFVLKISDGLQKAKAMPPEIKGTFTVGNVSVEEVRRRYGDVLQSIKLPDYMKPGSPPLTQMGCFLEFKSGDADLKRTLTLTNSTVLKSL